MVVFPVHGVPVMRMTRFMRLIGWAVVVIGFGFCFSVPQKFNMCLGSENANRTYPPLGICRFNMLLADRDAISDLPPIGYCNAFLIGSKYAGKPLPLYRFCNEPLIGSKYVRVGFWWGMSMFIGCQCAVVVGWRVGVWLSDPKFWV